MPATRNRPAKSVSPKAKAHAAPRPPARKRPAKAPAKQSTAKRRVLNPRKPARRARAAAGPTLPPGLVRPVSAQSEAERRVLPFKIVRASYDAAQTTDDNSRHWAAADALSADASMSAAVRQTIRNRARYETFNNSYARGICETLANDTIGTGPRLQLLGMDKTRAQEIEHDFAEWCIAVNLAARLRTARKCRFHDGEAFFLLATNPAIDHEVKLDPRLVEADQIQTPYLNATDPNEVDGIVLDAAGNPVTYHMLKDHPGANTWNGRFGEFTPVPAQYMVHCFRQDRPGQHRGLPEIMPALPLFAQKRRWTLAVLAAAETAADFAAVVYTDAPPDGAARDATPFDLVELEKRMGTVLPAGWKLGQLQAEQPTTTYGDFDKAILNEIARCVSMPLNVASCNSAGYNFASGRLDHMVYFKSLTVDRAFQAVTILRPILRAWLWEYGLRRGFMFGGPYSMPRHTWFWDGFEHADPTKEASARKTRLESGQTTYANELAKDGLDWEEVFAQQDIEAERLAKRRRKVEQIDPPVQPSAAPAAAAPAKSPSKAKEPARAA